MKNISKKKKNKGYSFVEVIISITLLFFIITVFIGLFTVNISKFTKMRNLLVSTYLAQTKLEELLAESKDVVDKTGDANYSNGYCSTLDPENPYVKDIMYKLEVKPFDSKLKEVVIKIYRKTDTGEEKLLAESWGLFPYRETGEEWGAIGIGSSDAPSGAIAYDFDENYIYVISVYGDSWLGIQRVNKEYLGRRSADDAWCYGAGAFIYTTSIGSIDVLSAWWCPLPSSVNCNELTSSTWEAADISWDRNRLTQFPGSSSSDLLFDIRTSPSPVDRDRWITVSNLTQAWPQITTEYNSNYVFVAGKLMDSINKHSYNRWSSKWPWEVLTRLEAKALLRISKSDWNITLFQDYSGDYWRQREAPLWPVNGVRLDENGNFLYYQAYNQYASGYTIQGLPDRPAECIKLYNNYLYYLSDENIFRGEGGGPYRWWIRRRPADTSKGGASVINDYFVRKFNWWQYPSMEYRAAPDGLAVQGNAFFITDQWRYWDWRTKVWQFGIGPADPIQLCQLTNKKFHVDPSLCIAVDNSYVYVGLTDCDNYGNIGSNVQGHIYRLPKGSFASDPEDLTAGRFTTQAPGYNQPDERLRCISGLVVDGDYLYFSDILTSRIYRMPKAGGTVYCYPVSDPIAHTEWISSPYYLKIDGNYLYYINTNSTNFKYGGETYEAPRGSLFRVLKAYSK